MKIHGKCDDVMRYLIRNLSLKVDKYDRTRDPLFHLAVPLRKDEEKTRKNSASHHHGGPGWIGQGLQSLGGKTKKPSKKERKNPRKVV